LALKLNMSKLPVQVSREGDLNFKRASKAFEKLAKASNEGCEKSKERAESHASDWDERAERCQEVGTQTENVGGKSVEFDSNDCRLMARIWRNCTEHDRIMVILGVGTALFDAQIPTKLDLRNGAEIRRVT